MGEVGRAEMAVEDADTVVVVVVGGGTLRGRG